VEITVAQLIINAEEMDSTRLESSRGYLLYLLIH
jgi:hypothetical protein